MIMVHSPKRDMLCATVLLLFVTLAKATPYNATFTYTSNDANNYTQLVLVDPVEDPISAPGAKEVITAGQPYTIRWKPTQTTGVTFQIVRGTPQEFYSFTYGIYVGDNEPNSGTYTWAVEDTLEPVKDYMLLLNTGGGLTPSSLSPIFEISNPNFKVVSSAAPASASSGRASAPSSTSQNSGSAASTALPSGQVESTSGASTSTPSAATGLSATSSPPTPTPGASNGGSSTSSGAVIGAAVGGALGGLVLILVAVIIFILRRRKGQNAGGVAAEDGHGKAELEATERARAELAGTEKAELGAGADEKVGDKQELGYRRGDLAELEAQGVHELPAPRS